MANTTKKKTVKTDKEKNTVKEPVVTEAEVLETEAGVNEETKEEEISADAEPVTESSGEEQVKEDNAGEEEPVRKKRKYTKRAAKENKTEKTASKKSKTESQITTQLKRILKKLKISKKYIWNLAIRKYFQEMFLSKSGRHIRMKATGFLLLRNSRYI